MLASAVDVIGTITSFGSFSDHFLVVVVGLVFMAGFIGAQGLTLKVVCPYLFKATDISGWIKEAASIQGMLRVALTIIFVVLYVAMLSGEFTFGFPRVNIVILIIYQILHPAVSRLVAKRALEKIRGKKVVYVSASKQVLCMVMSLVTSSICICIAIFMKNEKCEEYWIPLMIGVALLTFSVVQFMLEDFKGRNKVVYLYDSDEN
jgi:hypothetical protein